MPSAALLEALAGLFKVCRKTAQSYEADCPGAAECGYWDQHDKAAYEKARAILRGTYERAREPLPDWLLDGEMRDV